MNTIKLTLTETSNGLIIEADDRSYRQFIKRETIESFLEKHRPAPDHWQVSNLKAWGSAARKLARAIP